MKDLKTYKIIIPYIESADLSKKFKVEYLIEAENRNEAIKKADAEFNNYSLNSNASWVRTIDESGIRVWHVCKGDPPTPKFIDELISKLPGKTEKETLAMLERLGELEDAAATSKIISIMKKGSPKVVAAAVYTLGKFLDPTSFFAVKNTYTQKPFPEVKVAVVETLHKLALPGDDILDFYRTAMHDPLTREKVFKIENPALMQLWLAEVEGDKELELLKETTLKLGEGALMALIKINAEHPKVFSLAKGLVLLLMPFATENDWLDFAVAANKYGL